jgi:hypothetical protein
MSSGRVLALTVSALFAALAGCGDPAPEQTATTSGAPKPAARPKGADLPSEMVSAVAAGRNASVISIHFALASPPAVSTPLPVQIAIVPHEPFQTVSVHFEGNEGLTMPLGEDFGPVSDVKPEKPLSHQLMLLPAKEGMFMVTASVNTVGDEGTTKPRAASQGPPSPGHIMQFGLRLRCYVKTSRGHSHTRDL